LSGPIIFELTSRRNETLFSVFIKTSADAELLGPYSGEQLRKFANRGILKPWHLVSKDQQRWYEASTVKGLSFAAEETAAADETGQTHGAVSQARGSATGEDPAVEVEPSGGQTKKLKPRTKSEWDGLIALGFIFILCCLLCAVAHWICWAWRCLTDGPPVEVTGMWLLTWIGSAILAAVIPAMLIAAWWHLVLDKLLRPENSRKPVEFVIWTLVIGLALWPCWIMERNIWARRQRVVRSSELQSTFKGVLGDLDDIHRFAGPDKKASRPYVVGPTIIVYARWTKDDSGSCFDSHCIINPPELPHVQARNPGELQTLVLMTRARDEQRLSGYIIDWPSRTIKAATSVAGTEAWMSYSSVEDMDNDRNGWYHGPQARWRPFWKEMEVLFSAEDTEE